MARRQDVPATRLPSSVFEDAVPYDTIIEECPVEGIGTRSSRRPRPTHERKDAIADRSSPTAAAAGNSDDNVLSDILKQGHTNLEKHMQPIIRTDVSPSVTPSYPAQSMLSPQSIVINCEKDIPEDEYPADLKASFYDIFILAHENDRSQVYEFKNMLQTESDLVLKCGRKIKVLTSFDDVGMGLGEFTAVEYAMQYCTYVFLYITKSFCEDDGAKLHGDACLMKTVDSRSNKWCVVPVQTCKKNDRNYTLPYGINVLKGMAAYTRDTFFFSNIKKLIEDKLNIRLRNEKSLLKDRETWRQKEMVKRAQEKNNDDAEAQKWKMQMDKERSNRQDRPELKKWETATVNAPSSQSSLVPQIVPSGSHPQDMNMLKSRAFVISPDAGMHDTMSENSDKPLVMQETIASGISRPYDNDLEEDAYHSMMSSKLNSDRTMISELSYKCSHSVGGQTNRQISVERPSFTENRELPSARSRNPYSTSQTHLKSSASTFASQSDEIMRANLRQSDNEYSGDDRLTVVKEIHHHHYSQSEPTKQSSPPGAVYNITGARYVQIGADNKIIGGSPVDKTDRSVPVEAPSPGQKSPEGSSPSSDPENAHWNRFSERSSSFPGSGDISLPSNAAQRIAAQKSFNQSSASAKFEGSSPAAASRPFADGSCSEGAPIIPRVARISPFERDEQTVAKIRENPDGMEDQVECFEGHQNPEESGNTIPKVIDSHDVSESSSDDTSEQTQEKEQYGYRIDSCSEADEDLNGETHLRGRREAQPNAAQQQAEHLGSDDDLQSDAKISKDKKCT